MPNTATSENALQSGRLPPLVPGKPFLGHALEMYRAPLQLMRQLYQRYGPVYRIRVPGREFTILAGLEANRLLAETGDTYFRSAGEFDDFQRELKATHFLINMDGEAHQEMRRFLRPGYSKRPYLQQLDLAVEITRKWLRTWPEGGWLGVMDASQRIVSEQIGAVVIGHPPGDYFEDYRLFMNTILRTLVVGTWPRIMLRRPAYRKAKKRIWAMVRRLVEERRALPPEERPPGLLADVLHEFENDRRLISDEDDLLAAIIGPYLAGLDTVAGTLAFTIYAFLKHGVWDVVREEVDALFAEGLDAASLRRAKVLHAALMESMRLYPVVAFTPRRVVRDLQFGGYLVPAGSHVLIANGLTHLLPEHFPNPDVFDHTRHLPPRNEYRATPGAFAPFTLGPHTCLGAGMGEAQLMTTLAAIIHHADLALPSPDYEVRQALTPIPSPGFGFKVRVVRLRNL